LLLHKMNEQIVEETEKIHRLTSYTRYDSQAKNEAN